MNIQQDRIGEFDVKWVAGDPDGPAIVVFHGFGASNQDLIHLSESVRAKKGTTWYFPNGIIDLSPMAQAMGAANFHGRAWWPIDQHAMNYVLQRGSYQDLSGFVPPGGNELRTKVFAMLAKLNRPLSKITLAGFSQGAMLATDLVLNAEEAPEGLVVFSGTLVNEQSWKELASKRSGIQFFQSHGTKDEVLAFDAAKRLEALLRNAGFSGEFVSFEGGHEIPRKVLARLGEYLKR